MCDDFDVKRAMLDILREVKRICNNNNINYFLIGGTLIGAIRHKGYIPWDDDIDIGMIREDYEKFLNICKEQLNPQFKLSTWENETDYPNVYAKIKIKGTTYIERMTQYTKQDKEIFIDVFPFDNSPQSSVIAKLHGGRIAFYRRLLAIKCGVDFSGNSSLLKRSINSLLKLICSFFSRSHLYEKNNALCKLYNKTDTKYVVNACGSYSYMTERVPKELFNSLISTKFECYYFNVPKEYDRYLKHVYGNYMELPPENLRNSRHGIMEASLGDYNPISELSKDTITEIM